FAPRGVDTQTPHRRDEVYVVVRGAGWFVNGPDRHRLGPGDLLFVPAGVEHRFEEFSDDLAVWVVFYGPEGGEQAGPEVCPSPSEVPDPRTVPSGSACGEPFGTTAPTTSRSVTWTRSWRATRRRSSSPRGQAAGCAGSWRRRSSPGPSAAMPA